MSYHKIMVIGYAGSNPEHQVTPGGKDIATFPLYVNERYGDQEKSIRYKVKAWNQLSEVVMEHLLKGQLLLVEGVPEIEVWRSVQDETRAQVVVTAQVVRFLGAKPSSPASEEKNAY